MARKQNTETDRKRLVTDQFVRGLEKVQEAVKVASDPDAQLASWRRPWATLFAVGLPYSIATGAPYHGMNTVSTAFAVDQDGNFFDDPRWGTTNQWRVFCQWEKNPEWHGRADSFKGIKKWLWKGEGEEPKDFFVPGEEKRATLLCVWKPFSIFEDDENGERKVVGRYMRLVSVFRVYNAKQIACVPAMEVPERDPAARYQDCQEHLDALNVDLRHGGDRAFYHTAEDYIRLPQPGQFDDDESYWSTLWHEVGHWTGHESRLNREFGKRFGSDAYAMEELVAELASVMTCGALGVEGRLQHHEYIASWLKRLKEDPSALFTAASKAQAAATFALTGKAPEYGSDEGSDEGADADAAMAA